MDGSKINSTIDTKKVFEWVKSHKMLALSGLFMAIIIFSFGKVMITGEQASILGFKINPNVNYAACSIYDVCGTQEGYDGDELTFELFSIHGSFADGTVNVPYTQSFSVDPNTYSSIGNVAQMCNWKVDSIVPKKFEASFVSLSGGPNTTSSFTATPTEAGTYAVTMSVYCSATGQRTSKTLAWNVNGQSGELSIQGEFGDGEIGKPYSAKLIALNTVQQDVCTFEIFSVNPKMTNPKVERTSSKMNPSGPLLDTGSTEALFSAVPSSAGIHNIKISLTCSSTLEKRPARLVEKEFKFIVKGVSVPGNETLSITAKFPNGKVGKQYYTDVSSSFGGKGSFYNCNIALGSIKPVMAGATLYPIDNIVESAGTSALFVATPKTAGDYVLKLNITCNPKSGKAPSLFKEQEFKWKVDSDNNPTPTPTPTPSPSASGTCADPKLASKLKPVYRLWNAKIGDHLYTISNKEKPSGYKSEGIAGYVFKEQVKGTVPIKRFYNSSNTSHYYTTSTADQSKYGYAYESIIGYAFPKTSTKASAWYRLYKGSPLGDYLHTTSLQEKKNAIKAGYSDQGITAYICTSVPK